MPVVSIQKPTIGRVVEVALASEYGTPKRRPAIVVNAFGGHRINVSVMLDGANDADVIVGNERLGAKAAAGILSQTSVGYDAEGAVNTWRYPPFCGDKVDVDVPESTPAA